MRLWSLHPRFLDRQGLLGQWREAIQAKNALSDPSHSSNVCHARQLLRFKTSVTPLRNISIYLHHIADEMLLRGYHPNVELIPYFPEKIPHYIPVTVGQIGYEVELLGEKLAKRNPQFLSQLEHFWELRYFSLNPIFRKVDGDIESWEKQNS